MQGIVEDFLSLIAPIDPPGSSIFIIMVAIFVTLFSTLVSRRIIDIEKLKRYTRETKEFQSLKMKATRSQDRRILKKVEDNEARNQKMQKELASMRLKPLLYTFVPMIAIFILMSNYFSDASAIVANIPFSLPESIIFPFGYDCYNIRNDIESGKMSFEGITVGYSQVIKQKCIDNPNLHYVPTYIGWYFAGNIVIGAVIQKLAGLTPD